MSDRPEPNLISEPPTGRQDHPLAFGPSFRAGMREMLVLATSALIFGILFGAASIGVGFGLTEVIAMSVFVFAGASQFAALALWQSPLPFLAIAVTTALVNLRLLLLSVTIEPFMRRTPLWRKLPGMFLLTDQGWVLTMQADPRYDRFAYMLGGGLVLCSAWLVGNFVGFFGVKLLDPTTQKALGATGSIFIALLMAILFKGQKDKAKQIEAPDLPLRPAKVLAIRRAVVMTAKRSHVWLWVPWFIAGIAATAAFLMGSGPAATIVGTMAGAVAIWVMRRFPVEAVPAEAMKAGEEGEHGQF